MSGYFHSVAAMAATPGPRVRPITTPFATAPPLKTPEPVEIDAEAAAAESRPFAAVSDSPSRTAGQVERSPRLRSQPTAAEIAERLSAVTPEAPTANRPADESVARVEPRASRPPQRIDTRVVAPAARSSERVPAEPRERQARDDRSRITPARAAAAPPHAAIALDGRGRRHEPVRDNSPADVHIHIGRIELTAVVPPAPPSRPKPAAKPAMTLDDYLERRNRRAR